MGAFWGPWILNQNPPKKKPANQKSTFWGLNKSQNIQLHKDAATVDGWNPAPVDM